MRESKHQGAQASHDPSDERQEPDNPVKVFSTPGPVCTTGYAREKLEGRKEALCCFFHSINPKLQ